MGGRELQGARPRCCLVAREEEERLDVVGRKRGQQRPPLELAPPPKAGSPRQASRWKQSTSGFAHCVCWGCGGGCPMDSALTHSKLTATAAGPASPPRCTSPSIRLRPPGHNGASRPLLGPGCVFNQSKLLREEGRGTAGKR